MLIWHLLFQFVPVSSDPVTWHQREEPSSVLFAPSLLVLKLIRFPWDFSQVSFLTGEMLQSHQQFCGTRIPSGARSPALCSIRQTSGHSTACAALGFICAKVLWHYGLEHSGRIFLGVNNDISHFQRMLPWEHAASLQDKDKDKPVVLLLVPGGSCLQAPLWRLADKVYPAVRSAVQHRPEGRAVCAAQPSTG